MNMSIQTSEKFSIVVRIQCCPAREEVYKYNTLPIKKDCSHDFC